MPSVGSIHNSPDLQKMDMSGNRYGGKKFSFGNIAGDPFWLGTIGIGIVSRTGEGKAMAISG